MAAADKSKAEEKHKRTSQGRKDGITSRARKTRVEEEDSVTEKLSGSLTDEQEFVLA